MGGGRLADFFGLATAKDWETLAADEEESRPKRTPSGPASESTETPARESVSSTAPPPPPETVHHVDELQQNPHLQKLKEIVLKQIKENWSKVLDSIEEMVISSVPRISTSAGGTRRKQLRRRRQRRERKSVKKQRGGGAFWNWLKTQASTVGSSLYSNAVFLYEYSREIFPQLMKYMRENEQFFITIAVAVGFLLGMSCILETKLSEVVGICWDFIVKTISAVCGGIIFSLTDGIPALQGAIKYLTAFMDSLLGILRQIFVFVLKKIEENPALQELIRMVRSACQFLKKKVQLIFNTMADAALNRLTVRMKNFSGAIQSLPNLEDYSITSILPLKNWPHDKALVSNYPVSGNLFGPFSIRDLFTGDGQHTINDYEDTPVSQKYDMSTGIRLYKGVENIFEFLVEDIDIFNNHKGTLYGRGLYTSTVKDVAYMYAKSYKFRPYAGLITFKLDGANLDKYRGFRTLTDGSEAIREDHKKVIGMVTDPEKKRIRDAKLEVMLEKFQSATIGMQEFMDAVKSIDEEYGILIDKTVKVSFIMPASDQGIREKTYFVVVDDDLMDALTIEKIEVFNISAVKSYMSQASLMKRIVP